MPYLEIYIHVVWSTKNREPYLNKEIRQKVFKHIRENAKEKSIYIDFINGYTDHVHCLISLGNEQTISKVLQLIKGESSYWINKNNLSKYKFEWQDEYYAVSVSPSQLDSVRNYIKNQETHHKKNTFKQEYDEFILNQGFQKFDNH
jgi:REP-associated tyrosine transposase